MGLESLTEEEAVLLFNDIDLNGDVTRNQRVMAHQKHTKAQQQVLFVEFCAWVRRVLDENGKIAMDAEVGLDFASGIDASLLADPWKVHGDPKVSLRCFVAPPKGEGAGAKPQVLNKNLAAFDELEAEIKALIGDLEKLKAFWEKLKAAGASAESDGGGDAVGDGAALLATFDKELMERYPLLNHKPALLAAYKRATGRSSADSEAATLGREELKKLLWNCFSFNKTWFVFDEVDENKTTRSTCGSSSWAAHCSGRASTRQKRGRSSRSSSAPRRRSWASRSTPLGSRTPAPQTDSTPRLTVERGDRPAGGHPVFFQALYVLRYKYCHTYCEIYTGHPVFFRRLSGEIGRGDTRCSSRRYMYCNTSIAVVLVCAPALTTLSIVCVSIAVVCRGCK